MRRFCSMHWMRGMVCSIGLFAVGLTGAQETSSHQHTLPHTTGSRTERITTAALHLVMSNTLDATELDLAIPQNVGGVAHQRLSTLAAHTFVDTCISGDDAVPSPPRVEASVTRTSATTIAVVWTANERMDMAAPSNETASNSTGCPTQRLLPRKVMRQQTMTLGEDTIIELDAWQLRLTTDLRGIGAPT